MGALRGRSEETGEETKAQDDGIREGDRLGSFKAPVNFSCSTAVPKDSGSSLRPSEAASQTSTRSCRR
eukprot:2251793-Pyramimonas_sp.AAC.1